MKKRMIAHKRFHHKSGAGQVRQAALAIPAFIKKRCHHRSGNKNWSHNGEKPVIGNPFPQVPF
jgi:hypothetical protein